VKGVKERTKTSPKAQSQKSMFTEGTGKREPIDRAKGQENSGK
jgi:hypothetical protein